MNIFLALIAAAAEPLATPTTEMGAINLFQYFRAGMQKKLILDSKQLDITLSRLCQQLIENHADFTNCVILGLQPRGIFLAELVHQRLKTLKVSVPLGYLDATFHRDDFRRRDTPAIASETRVDFPIEGKNVILIDDV